jgi:hypothetical protein
MYAESNGKRHMHTISGENVDWKTIRLEHVVVKGGKVEIGFVAHGNANAFCLIDDVGFTRD